MTQKRRENLKNVSQGEGKENFKKRHIEKGAELIGNVHSKDMEGLVLRGEVR